MPVCSSCGKGEGVYRIKNPNGKGFHEGRFCKSCRDRAVYIIRSQGPIEFKVLLKNLYGGVTPLEGNPVMPGSKARFDRHRQAPPECFHSGSYRTVPLFHTDYPKTAPYNIPGALAVVSRIKRPCAAKYAERGVRVRFRKWATQSILTPKEAGLRPTRSERALENPTVLYSVTAYDVRKFGKPFRGMREWHTKNVGGNPKMGTVLKGIGKGAMKVTKKAAKVAAPHVKKAGKKGIEAGQKMAGKAMIHVKKTAAQMEQENPQDAEKLKMFEKEKAEHPTLSDEEIWTIVADHMRARGNPMRYGQWEWMGTNRFSGYCYKCGAQVPVGAGFIEKGEEGWRTYCRRCGICPECGAAKLPRYPLCRDCARDEREGFNPAEHNQPLTTEQRKKLPASDFVFPEKREYPIDTPERARTAIAYAKKYHGERGAVTKKVMKAVCKRYPEVFKACMMNPVPNRHYTPKERRAITSSPEFKAWVKTRQYAGFKGPKQGYFHAFMTDVGKGAHKAKLPVWKKDPTRADLTKEDVPSMKKHYHGLGAKNPVKFYDYPVFVTYKDKLWWVPKMEGYRDLNGYILKIGPKGGWRWEHPTEAGRYIPQSPKIVTSRGEGVIKIEDQTPELQVFITNKLKEKGAMSGLPSPSKNPIPELSMPGDEFDL